MWVLFCGSDDSRLVIGSVLRFVGAGVGSRTELLLYMPGALARDLDISVPYVRFVTY